MKTSRLEQRLITYSTLMMSIVAIGGLGFGVFSGSHSILFDGYFSVIAVAIKLLMFIIVRLVERQTSDRFQFGFWHLEPMVLVLEGAFIFVIAVYALVNGVIGIVGGGHPVEFGAASVYAVLFTVLNGSFFFYVRNRNKTLKSRLIQYDNVSWLVDAMLSAGLMVSFLLAWWLQHTQWAWLSVYVDPLLLVLLAVAMFPMALEIMMPSFREVLGMAPEPLDARVQEKVSAIVKRYGFIGYETYVEQHGRGRFIEIHILVPDDYRVESLTTLDVIRQELADALGKPSPHRWLTISFTCDEKWMSP